MQFLSQSPRTWKPAHMPAMFFLIWLTKFLRFCKVCSYLLRFGSDWVLDLSDRNGAWKEMVSTCKLIFLDKGVTGSLTKLSFLGNSYCHRGRQYEICKFSIFQVLQNLPQWPIPSVLCQCLSFQKENWKFCKFNRYILTMYLKKLRTCFSSILAK
jgi:hypothetical protein